MRDSIPPFLGLFLGCPVVRSLSWCGRREEGRTRGADWHPTANLWQSLTMISPSHSFIVLFQPFPFEKNLEIHFFQIVFCQTEASLAGDWGEPNNTCPIIFPHRSKGTFRITTFPLFPLFWEPFFCHHKLYFNCQVKPDDGSDTKISINPRRSKVKKLNKNQTSTRQCDTIFTLFSFNFHKTPPPAISTQFKFKVMCLQRCQPTQLVSSSPSLQKKWRGETFHKKSSLPFQRSAKDQSGLKRRSTCI